MVSSSRFSPQSSRASHCGRGWSRSPGRSNSSRISGVGFARHGPAARRASMPSLSKPRSDERAGLRTPAGPGRRNSAGLLAPSRDEDRIGSRDRALSTSWLTWLKQDHLLAHARVVQADPAGKARLVCDGHLRALRCGQLVVGKLKQRLEGRRIQPCDSIGHERGLPTREVHVLPSACVQTSSGGCIAPNPLLVAAQPMGACGANHGQRPVFRMGHIPFLELIARGDIRRHSGQLSRALRVRSVRPCARRAADRRGRPQPRRARPGLARFERIRASSIESPLVGRDEAGKAFAALAAAARPRPDHHQVPRRARAERPQAPASARSIRAFQRIAAEHRGETTAEVVTAQPLNDDQVAALKAAAARPRRPRRHARRRGRPRHPRRTRRQARQPA